MRKQKEEAKENERRGKGKGAHVTSGSCLPMCDHMEHTHTDISKPSDGGDDSGGCKHMPRERHATCRRLYPVTCHRFHIALALEEGKQKTSSGTDSLLQIFFCNHVSTTSLTRLDQ